MKSQLFYLLLLFANCLFAQTWNTSNADGTYSNPIIHADFSDPDIIRVGDDFFMTASSFNCAPGLPILHSKDLVSWTIVNHALKKQPPYDVFDKPVHGGGVWAPAIRFHKGLYYIFYPDPDFGIYRVTAKDPFGEWSEPHLVKAGKGLIDPCPLWDDDGKAYLVYAFAGSRAGFKSILVVSQMDIEGSKLLDEGVMIVDGHDEHPTLEGPKFYKRKGFYYIAAPAGGVATGWQLVFRSKNVFGPYEIKKTLTQGKSPINGPHQGGWVDVPTAKGDTSWWFVHFQDKGAYGRVVHLQPMFWHDDFPVMGIDDDNDGVGEPVLSHKKPILLKNSLPITPSVSDEFEDSKLGLQWQWHANPKLGWAFPYPAKSSLRLFATSLPDSAKNLWDAPNLLLQKFPAETFTVTTKLHFQSHPTLLGEQIGLLIMGSDYAFLSLVKKSDGYYLSQMVCKDADKRKKEVESTPSVKMPSGEVWLRVRVEKGTICSFSYSSDGQQFDNIGQSFAAKEGRWIGAKVGLFCTRQVKTNDSGFADIEFFRIEK